MTDLGHSRRSEGTPITSGLPPTSDILRVRRQVSKVPRAELSCLEARQIQSMKNCVGLGLWTRDDTAAPVA
jgi:hypothetical protein